MFLPLRSQKVVLNSSMKKEKLKPQKASQNLTSKQNSAGNSRSDKIIIGFIQTLRRKKRKEKPNIVPGLKNVIAKNRLRRSTA